MGNCVVSCGVVVVELKGNPSQYIFHNAGGMTWPPPTSPRLPTTPPPHSVL